MQNRREFKLRTRGGRLSRSLLDSCFHGVFQSSVNWKIALEGEVEISLDLTQSEEAWFSTNHDTLVSSVHEATSPLSEFASRVLGVLLAVDTGVISTLTWEPEDKTASHRCFLHVVALPCELMLEGESEIGFSMSHERMILGVATGNGSSEVAIQLSTEFYAAIVLPVATAEYWPCKIEEGRRARVGADQ